MIPTNREPSDAELAAMSDEELDALLASTQQAPTEQAPSTFETVAQEAGNMAIAASQSLRQGVSDAFTGGALLARDLSDAAGFTDKEVTQQYRDARAEQQATTQASAEALGYGGVGKAARFIGEMGPSMLVGGSVMKGVQGLLGTGRLAAAGAASASGAVTSLIAGAPEDGLTGRLTNAATGVAVGGALGGILGSGAKKAANEVLKLDPAKAEAFRAAGMTSTPLHMRLADSVSDNVRQIWDGMANTLNKIPLLGLKQRFRHGTMNKAISFTRKVFDEIDEAAPDTTPLFNQIKASMPVGYKMNAGTVSKTASQAAARIRNNSGLLNTPEKKAAIEQLDEIASKGKMGFGELWDLRDGIDDAINHLKSKVAGKKMLHEYYGLRKMVSKRLAGEAMMKGKGKEWMAANEIKQQKMAGEALRAEFDKATKVDGALFNFKTLTDGMKTAIQDLKDRGLDVPEVSKKAVEQVQIIAKEMGRSATKAAAPGLSGNLQGIGAGALAAVGGGYFFGGAETSAVAATSAVILLGLGRMITTRSGASLIASLAGKSNPLASPTMKQILLSAMAIGQVEENKDDLETRALESMSDEELDALLAKHQGQQ